MKSRVIPQIWILQCWLWLSGFLLYTVQYLLVLAVLNFSTSSVGWAWTSQLVVMIGKFQTQSDESCARLKVSQPRHSLLPPPARIIMSWNTENNWHFRVYVSLHLLKLLECFLQNFHLVWSWWKLLLKIFVNFIVLSALVKMSENLDLEIQFSKNFTPTYLHKIWCFPRCLFLLCSRTQVTE